MKKVLLVNAREEYFRELFVASCEQRQLECQLLWSIDCIFHIEDGETHLIHNGEVVDCSPADYVFIRMRAMDSFFSYLLSEYLLHKGVRFTDEINRSHSNNYGKIAQLVRLTPLGIKFPESVICRRHSYKLHRDLILQSIGFPCVFKRTGARGEAVWKIDNEEQLLAKFEEAPFEPSIIQRYIPNDYDIRLIIFKDNVIGAMKRSAGDGFANTGYDAVLESTAILEEEAALAIEATRKAQLDFAGVDIVRTDEGLMLWEINMCPQLDRFMANTGIAAVDKLVGYIESLPSQPNN